MTFDRAEIEVLALCAWCRDLPVHGCKNIPAEIIEVLLERKLIRQSKNGLGYRCTPEAFELLHRAEMEFTQDKTYRTDSNALTRRMQMAEITSFFWRYGADVFENSPPAKTDKNLFLPSFVFRRQKHSNILGATNLTGFYYAENTVFVPYYIARENNGVYPDVEQRTFRSELLLSGRRPHIIYTGDGELDKIIETVSYKKERSKKSTTFYYKDAIDRFNCPVALMPLTEDGMRQLRILSVPDYRQRLVKNILGKNYIPPISAQSDGRNKTDNFIIGIDCNILRFENAVKSGKPTKIFVLPFQAESVQEMVRGTKAKCYVINLRETEEFLGLSNNLPKINYKPFQTGKGEYIHVPSLGKNKKAGR